MNIKALKSDVLVLFGLLIIALGLMIMSFSYTSVTAKMLPMIVDSIWIVLLIAAIIIKLRRPPKEDLKNDDLTVAKRDLYMLILSMWVYLLLLYILGYLIATFLFVGWIMWYLGVKNLIKVLVMSIVSTSFIYCVFLFLLKITLPGGLISN